MIVLTDKEMSEAEFLIAVGEFVNGFSEDVPVVPEDSNEEELLAEALTLAVA